MGIVTLTTDLGLKDYYVGTLKGALLSECPDIQIVDITHNVKNYDIIQASIVVKHSYRDFPSGTIHIVGVNTAAFDDNRHIIVFIHQQYFIMPDNGLASLIFDSIPDEIVEINLVQQADQLTFPAKDIYVKAACHLHRGGSLNVIGKSISDVRESVMLRAGFDQDTIWGSVIHVDHYGNILTNIDKNLFSQFNKYPKFKIELPRKEYNILKISKTYSDVVNGEKLALFNTLSLLEIAINQGNASELLGLDYRDTIRIEFDVS